jgi:polyisoprenoid-binding protein YceI
MTAEYLLWIPVVYETDWTGTIILTKWFLYEKAGKPAFYFLYPIQVSKNHNTSSEYCYQHGSRLSDLYTINFETTFINTKIIFMETSVITSARTKWVLDPSHSELLFKVKHLMISNVKGEFQKFNAEISGDDFFTSKINVMIDASSISTNNEQRDVHLKSADFFDVENHRELSFKSTSFKQIADDEYQLNGLLTIKGISKEVSLEVEFGGINKDPWGNEKAGFSFKGKINRKDWGLNWNAALETGGVLVSDEVKISGEIQFAKQS